jgi:putative ubiquitin-RnfH superfamily antitoxin RatB of RatAB toxin-antitoxin module
MAEEITIEVAYALPNVQTLLKLAVPAGTTAEEAVRGSGILQKHSEIDLEHAKLGIFGKHVKHGALLREGDRVEIYRPLIADPKEVRRQRAAEGKVMKKGGGALEGEPARD